jgi:hypothetical protein
MKSDDVYSKLKHKFGFNDDQASEKGHRHLVKVLADGRKLKTMVSRGTAEIGKALCGSMARQVRVTSIEFRSMVGCTMSRAEFEKRVGGS